MKRKQFIKNAAAFSLPFVLNGLGVRVFGRESVINSMLPFASPDSDRILVMIQLFGGNDGLNTIIPLDQYDNYFKVREKIAIEEKKILSLNGITHSGFHPALAGLQQLYNDKQLSVLQSVGYANPDFSHFRSSDIWMSGSASSQSLNTGWTGRLLDNVFPAYPAGYPNSSSPDPLAIQIGLASSLVFQGPKIPMSLNIADPDKNFDLVNGFTDAAPSTHGGDELKFIRLIAEQVTSYSQVIKAAAYNVKSQSGYPANNPLAQQLKTVARLIKGGLKTRFYLVSLDGFDTHGEQAVAGDTTKGRHADLLQFTGDAIKAFQDDLEFLGISEKVAGMTFSEFGRRIAANESMGTDHGAAAPLFVFGKKVKGGFIGENPVVPEKVGVEENLPMKIDFRSVYAALLRDWMGVPESLISSLLFKDEKPLQLFT